LNLKQTPLDFMCTLFPSATPLDVRKHLGRFGVTGDLALQTMGTLSGGQKSRVAFSVVVRYSLLRQ
jgi:ATP-binding cassette subfamily F protein 3